MRDDMQGWENIASLSKQCSVCRHTVDESHTLVACEYGRKEFPHATHCHWFEPNEVDE